MKANLLTRKQAAEYLNVSTQTVARLSDSGELTCYRVGNMRRYSQEALQAYLEQTARTTEVAQ